MRRRYMRSAVRSGICAAAQTNGTNAAKLGACTRTVLMLVGFVRIGAAQAVEPTPLRAFRSFDRATHKGLPQSTIPALLQDDRGILWVATLDGIATFDGSEIAPVPDQPGSPRYGSFSALAARREHGIYAAGASGVHVWDGQSWTRIETPIGVSAVAEDAWHRLWVLDIEGKLLCRDANPDGSWIQQQPPAWIGPSVGIQSDPGGRVYIAGRNGVVVVEEVGYSDLGSRSPPPAQIGTIIVGSDGTCWAGTFDGQILYKQVGHAEWSRIPIVDWQGGRIRCLAEDRRGRIWAGGRDGIVAFGSRTGPWQCWGPRNGLKLAGIQAICADREGTIWFGLNGSGLQQWVGEAWSHRQVWFEEAQVANRTTMFGITGTRDGFLAAAFNRGLWEWNGERWRTYGVADGLTEDVRYAVEPEPGTIWAACRFGIFESRNGHKFERTFEIPDGFGTGVFMAPDRTWYATTSRMGILVRRGDAWVPAEDLNQHLPDPSIRSLAWSSDGSIWAATMRGVVRLNGGKGTLLTPDPASGLPKAVNAVMEIEPGEVWVAGYGGICVWRDEHWSHIIGPQDGLPGNTIYSLAKASDGSIWAGGSAGVARYSMQNWTVYDARTGMIEDECNLGGLWAAPDGSVYVGTMASLARFDPRTIELPRAPLRLFWRGAPEASAADGLRRVPPDRRSLALAWVAPWLGPHRVEYRTRVPRLRPGWSAPDLRGDLSLDNMDAGRWRVEVSARIQDGAGSTWSEPIALDILVEPHAWETLAAKILFAILAAAAVFAIVRLRTWQLARRAAELQQAVENELADIRVLSGLLPICASCKKIRDDKGYWNQLEAYIHTHSEAMFTHGLCPDCMKNMYPEYAPPDSASKR